MTLCLAVCLCWHPVSCVSLCHTGDRLSGGGLRLPAALEDHRTRFAQHRPSKRFRATEEVSGVSRRLSLMLYLSALAYVISCLLFPLTHMK